MRIWALYQAQATEFRRNPTLAMMPLVVIFLAFIWSLASSGEAHMTPFFASASMMMCCYMVGFQIPALSLAEDREKRTLEAVFLTPVRPLEVIGARVLFATTVTLLAAVACLAIYRFTPARPGVTLLAFVLALAFAMAIGVTVGLYATDQKSAGVIGAPIMVVLLMGSTMPWNEVLPSVWEAQLWLPTRPLSELFTAGITGDDLPVLRHTLVMLPYIAGVFWLCARQIRKSASAR